MVGQGSGVCGCAVDVGGGAGAEHWHAEDVEAGGAGDHAAVVADVAGRPTALSELAGPGQAKLARRIRSR